MSIFEQSLEQISDEQLITLQEKIREEIVKRGDKRKEELKEKIISSLKALSSYVTPPFFFCPFGEDEIPIDLFDIIDFIGSL